MGLGGLQGECGKDDRYDERWKDPLPHTFAPRKAYLSPVTRDTKAVVIFLHGRGDRIDDMVGVFLPILARRFGGTAGVIKDKEQEADQQAAARDEETSGRRCVVALIGLEARDNVWYPQRHTAQGHEAQINAPYQHSALELLRSTLVELVVDRDVPVDRIALVGFSQGALLANTYVLSALQRRQRRSSSDDRHLPALPLPAHILPLAGSLFTEQPLFPDRRFGAAHDEDAYQRMLADEAQRMSRRSEPFDAVPQGGITVRLLCGTSDRFFATDEIEWAAAALAEARTTAASSQQAADSEAARAAKALQISVGFEPGAPHQVTERMTAAVVAAIETMLQSAT